MRPEARQLLTEAVRSCDMGCALARLERHTRSPNDSLSVTAMMHGFTLYEAYGIMDGWDTTEGFAPCFDWKKKPGDSEYAEGFALGRELALLVLPPRRVVLGPWDAIATGTETQ